MLTNKDMVPMSVFQHLLVKAGSEATELAHALLKGVEYGVDDKYPGTDTTILQKIEEEYNDLLGVIEMLSDLGFPIKTDVNLINKKKEKVTRFMQVAIDQGVLHKDNNFLTGEFTKL